MAHFAQLDENNTVLQVVVIGNDMLLNDAGVEEEQKGIDFCKSLFGQNTRWVQTSYNSKIRKRYAGVGFTYDPVRDAFIPAKPYPSWVLNEETLLWDSPVPMPDNPWVIWDEEKLSWVKFIPKVSVQNEQS